MPNYVPQVIHNLAQDFDIENLSKSPARFDLQKLQWFNREYLKRLTLSEFVYRADTFLHTKKYKQQLPAAENSLTSQQTSKIVILNQGCTQVLANSSYQLPPLPEPFSETQPNSTKDLINQLNLTLNPQTAPPIHTSTNWNEATQTIHATTIYYCLEATSQTPPIEVNENTYTWHNLSEFLAHSPELPFSIWHAFTPTQSLAYPSFNDTISQYYLALFFDQNRLTTFSELGRDSHTVLAWQAPPSEMIRWKKSTTSESLASLQEIRPLIKQLQQDSQAKQHQLYHSILESNFPDYFHPLAEFFETEIKKWLTTNDKSPGNYLWPLRVALSGASKSPSPFELLSVLTPEQADERINQVLSQKNTES